MNESPNKRKQNGRLPLWLLLVVLAVCLAILLYFYGQKNGFTLLRETSSQTESGASSLEEESSSKSQSSSAGSRTSGSGSERTSEDGEEDSDTTHSSTQSLPESMGETSSPALSAPSSTMESPSASSSLEEPPSSFSQTTGLTVIWETDEQQALAQLWTDYAQQEPLFQKLASLGTPVTVFLFASDGTDTVTWKEGYVLSCYGKTADMARIYENMALLMEEILRQNGWWDQSVSDYLQQNPHGFSYGNPSQRYVGLYFFSIQGQQSLEADRLEVWVLVLSNARSTYDPDFGGGLAGKYDLLLGVYYQILM